MAWPISLYRYSFQVEDRHKKNKIHTPRFTLHAITFLCITIHAYKFDNLIIFLDFLHTVSKGRPVPSALFDQLKTQFKSGHNYGECL